MEVLIISISDELNGASKALLRINNSLNTLNHLNSRMLVYKKISDQENIKELKLTFFKKLIFNIKKKFNNYLVGFLYPNKNDSTLFSHNYFSSNEIYNQIKNEKFDILILGWVNSGIFNFNKIKNISSPILIVMEDLWYFTGGCHYNFSCEKFKNGCFKCPFLNSEKINDLSFKEQKLKNNIYSNNKNLHFIAVSKWLKNVSDQSKLLKKRKVFYIPNTIDTSFYKKKKYDLHKRLKLPSNKKFILFGATRAISDKRKGLDYLIKAFKLLNDKNLVLIIYGTDQRIEQNENIINYGKIDNECDLINLLSASDLFVAPSIQEAFGLTVLEALSCSTPVVSFENTGIETQIDHKKTGYLAKHLNEEDLAEGIRWVLLNNKNNCLGNAARKKVENEFSYDIIGQQYFELINNIIND